MIWIAVMPILTVLNVLLRDVIVDLPVVTRTLILVSIAVPIVVYGAMPVLHRIRRWLILRLRAPRQHDAPSAVQRSSRQLPER